MDDAHSGNSVIVECASGHVEGRREKGVSRFKGIPYAVAPTAARRWQAPERIRAYRKGLTATAFGPIAPQIVMPPSPIPALDIGGIHAEDCLSLNIWTPAEDSEARLPVLVWLHGGGFALGAGSQCLYQGEALARQGRCVVVTINYRLGIFGFLRLMEVTDGRIPSSGNEGLLDQIAALEWVRDNIDAFGGNPQNVTIAGESAGAFSVCCLMAMPLARGLFHKAIAQSGAASTVCTIDRACDVAKAVFQRLQISPREVDALMACSAEQLVTVAASLAALPSDPSGQFGTMPFQPVSDGMLLPDLPLTLIRHGCAAEIPLLVGTTRDEWDLFADPSLAALTLENLREHCAKRLGRSCAERIMHHYLGQCGPEYPGLGLRVLSRIETDRVFTVPAAKVLDAQAAHQPKVYAYRFDWPAPFGGGVFGACHTVELGFLFGTYGLDRYQAFYGEATPTHQLLANAVQNGWASFCWHGVPDLGNGMLWPRWGAGSAAMVFDANPRVEHLVDQAMVTAWDGPCAAQVGRA